jgi:PAS domain S-box-containing protein
MTQKRKVAIAYLAAVPAVLAVVLFQYTALFRVARSEQSMTDSAAVLRQCHAVMEHLNKTIADSQQYGASGRANQQALQTDVSQLRSVVRHLDELTRKDPSAHSQFERLVPLIEDRIISFENAASGVAAVISRHDSDARVDEGGALDHTRALIVKMESAQGIRLQQESEEGAWNARLASNAVTYGGGVVIWLVGVAALLLFHDDKARAWTGVERRVHTRILETLPLSVCLTTHSGTILYANPAAEDLFEHAPGELVGTNVACLHASGGEGDQRTVEEIFDGLVADQVWSGDLRIPKKDGAVLEAASWIVNMGVAGKLYRVFIHQPPCRLVA